MGKKTYTSMLVHLLLMYGLLCVWYMQQGRDWTLFSLFHSALQCS